MIILVILACLELLRVLSKFENNAHSYEDQGRDHERVCNERRFNEMNRQIGELTSLVRTLTERISSSNREENGNNSPRSRSTSHSDTHCFGLEVSFYQ